MYSERMLHIADPVKPTDWGGRSAHKRSWMNEARMEIWRECSSLEEFARRANISAGRARELDQHYSKVLCVEPIKKAGSRCGWFEELMAEAQ